MRGRTNDRTENLPAQMTLREKASLLGRCSVAQDDRGSRSSGYFGYELLTTLAERQLATGQSVILDSVVSFERIRSQWRKLAERYGAECVGTFRTGRAPHGGLSQHRRHDPHPFCWKVFRGIIAPTPGSSGPGQACPGRRRSSPSIGYCSDRSMRT
jgi:hypothetical protein